MLIIILFLIIISFINFLKTRKKYVKYKNKNRIKKSSETTFP